MAKNQFGKALKVTRDARGLTQEDFSVESSRTYVSSLERGLKSPTLSKIEELAEVLKVHPLTLLTLAYLPSNSATALDKLSNQVRNEIVALLET